MDWAIGLGLEKRGEYYVVILLFYIMFILDQQIAWFIVYLALILISSKSYPNFDLIIHLVFKYLNLHSMHAINKYIQTK